MIPTERLIQVLHNIRKASELGMSVILNPAPALILPDDIYQHIDTLILNESEAMICAGVQGGPVDQLASLFLRKGVKDAVIVTLGGQGLAYATAVGYSGIMSARKVSVIDTTAAGDTFVGAYAVKRANASSLNKFDHATAMEFATLAASKAVERRGAMAAIPFLHELS